MKLLWRAILCLLQPREPAVPGGERYLGFSAPASPTHATTAGPSCPTSLSVPTVYVLPLPMRGESGRGQLWPSLGKPASAVEEEERVKGEAFTLNVSPRIPKLALICSSHTSVKRFPGGIQGSEAHSAQPSRSSPTSPGCASARSLGTQGSGRPQCSLRILGKKDRRSEAGPRMRSRAVSFHTAPKSQ